ncbi:MAG: hypothetical protein HC769_16410 [Cyanobacteria bacterium CRU_2_1]|nr:hypothetical protein [Cyanobacteria bacterium CRU_2_1]
MGSGNSSTSAFGARGDARENCAGICQKLDYPLTHIPPLCKLNPFYEEIMMLRFKALQFLADVCCEDVTIYC